MAKYKEERALPNNDGYCDWVQPTMEKPYKMACCDCGLVHDVEFQIYKARRLGVWWTLMKKLSSKSHRVLFRVRRNNRATGQMRRHKK